jgi:8-oxo-dGTP pyrophosphatase MutT (NUDIX family)
MMKQDYGIFDEEVQSLIREQGKPPIASRHVIGISTRIFDRWFARFRDGSRIAEVVFAIRNTGGDILVMSKDQYPPDEDGGEVFRIPSGGVNRGESLVEALRREIEEETALETARYMLRGITDTLFHRSDGDTETEFPFLSFLFTVEWIAGIPRPLDREEGISRLRWIPVHELATVADTLKSLKGELEGWGEFRSIACEMVIGL